MPINNNIKAAKNFIEDNKKKSKIVPVKKIPTKDIYNTLKGLIHFRYELELKQDYIWKEVKSGDKKHQEISSLSNLIGTTNHKINLLINDLLKYKNSNQTYTLAESFIQKEITRVETIIKSWEKKIKLVNRGRSSWIDAHGQRYNDSNQAYEYLNKQQMKLKNYKELLSKIKLRKGAL